MNKEDRIDCLAHEIDLIGLHTERAWAMCSDWEKNFWVCLKKSKELELTALETFEMVKSRREEFFK